MQSDFDIDNLQSTGTAVSVDLSPIIDRLDTQNSYLIITNIILVSILIFLTFRNMLKGLFH